jgi:hypothetical protein
MNAILFATPGVNFTNILRTAFAHVDPKSVKRYWGFDWILTLLGATSVKAVRRTLMKLRPAPADAIIESNVHLWIYVD